MTQLGGSLGNRRHRIALLQTDKVTDQSGRIRVAYRKIADVWASYSPSHSGVTVRAGRLETGEQAVFRFACADAYRSVSRIEFKDRLYEVTSLHDPSGVGAHLEAGVREITPAVPHAGL